MDITGNLIFMLHANMIHVTTTVQLFGYTLHYKRHYKLQCELDNLIR